MIQAVAVTRRLLPRSPFGVPLPFLTQSALEADCRRTFGVRRHIAILGRRHRPAVLPVSHSRLLVGAEFRHVEDLDALSLAVGFESRIAEAELNRPPFAFLARGKMVGIPLQADI